MKRLIYYIFSIALVTSLGDCSKSGNTDPVSTTTKVIFKNNTYTPVNLTFEGQTYTLTIGETAPFVESANTNLSYSAITVGSTGTTADLGSHNIISGAAGQTTNISLDVPNTYVYIILNDSSPSYTVHILTYEYSTQANTTYIDPITVPNDGKNYGILYLPAVNLSRIEAYNQNYSLPLTRLQQETPTWSFGPGWSTPLPNLSGSVNQEMILTLK